MTGGERARGAIGTMAALVLVAVAAALAAGLAQLAATEAVLASRHRVLEHAMMAADECLAQVVGALPAGWALTPALAGADGVAGTGDDGTLHAPASCTASGEALDAGARLLVRVHASVPRGRRMVDAVVGRTPGPFDGALVWLADPGSLGPVLGSLRLDGLGGTSEEPAALATPGDPESLDAWIAAQGGRVQLGAGVAIPRYAPPPPLTELEARVQAIAAPGTGSLVGSGIPPVAVTFVDGDLALSAPALGAGLLVVAGRLDIADALAFTGIVVAREGVRVASGGSLLIEGALWLGGSSGPVPALDAVGEVRIRGVGDAIHLADGLLALPRLPRLLGIRDPA